MLTPYAIAQIEDTGSAVLGLVPKTAKAPAKLLQQYQANVDAVLATEKAMRTMTGCGFEHFRGDLVGVLRQ